MNKTVLQNIAKMVEKALSDIEIKDLDLKIQGKKPYGKC